MLKDRKIKHKEFIVKNSNGEIIDRVGDDVYGLISLEGYYNTCYKCFSLKDIKQEIDCEEYYYAQIESEIFDSDYHTYSVNHSFNGSYLCFNLNIIDTKKYFNKEFNLFDEDEFIKGVEEILRKNGLLKKNDDHMIEVNRERKILEVSLNGIPLKETKNAREQILEYVYNYFNKLNLHITRMFGSYILLKNVDGKLTAVYSTPLPIKYCPLMVKLLKEVGGNDAEELINSLNNEKESIKSKLMCELINKVVIEGGYFDTNRPLNSCESNVLFGASETMYSAFNDDLIEASVIVSNNLGTIITTNAPSTQGAVKRMTGLFHTTPDKKLINRAYEEGIIPVFPNTAEIDQLEGVKKAISLGYKNIVVTVASYDNVLHKKISELESMYNVNIYKFGLCSTGIDKETAIIMKDYADVIWSCASLQVKEEIEPNAICQVGVKIPVHIMTKKGWEIIRNHLISMKNSNVDVILTKGENKPVLINSDNEIIKLTKKDLHKCIDCPFPCV